MLYTSHLRLTRPPLCLETGEVLGAVVQRMLRILAEQTLGRRALVGLDSGDDGEPWDVDGVELRLDVLQEEDEIEDEEVVRVGHHGRVERRERRTRVVDEAGDP